jgi:peptidoglycan hydrolase-like protein with peptidoglycan-binding domain
VPTVPVDGMLGSSTAEALRSFQTARGLPPSGTTDPATWAAVLALPLTPKDWTGAGAVAARAGRATGPRTAGLPARRDEIPAAAARR